MYVVPPNTTCWQKLWWRDTICVCGATKHDLLAEALVEGHYMCLWCHQTRPAGRSSGRETLSVSVVPPNTTCWQKLGWRDTICVCGATKPDLLAEALVEGHYMCLWCHQTRPAGRSSGRETRSVSVVPPNTTCWQKLWWRDTICVCGATKHDLLAEALVEGHYLCMWCHQTRPAGRSSGRGILSNLHHLWCYQTQTSSQEAKAGDLNIEKGELFHAEAINNFNITYSPCQFILL